MEVLQTRMQGIDVSWIAAGAERLRKTGVLRLERDGVRKDFYYSDGQIVFVSSTREGERFGEFLESRGCFDRQRMLDLIAEARNKGVRFTADLMAEGVFQHAELEDALTELVVVALRDVFSWQEARCSFHDELPIGVLQGPVSIALSNAVTQALGGVH